MSTRSSNSRRQRPDVVIGLQESGDVTQMVVVRTSGAGQAARIVFAKSLSAASLSTELGMFKGATVVRVAPLEQTIARMGVVPTASDAEMAAAVNLMAEAEFPGSVPAHRIAAAVLPGSPAQTRPALLTAWLGRSAARSLRDGMSERWTTPLSALVGLRGGKTGAIVLADRKAGAVAVLLQDDAIQAARVVIDDVNDDVPWERLAASSVQDLAAMSGADLSDEAALQLVAESAWSKRTEWLSGRVTGTLIDSAWLEKYGTALGAAMLLADEQLGLSSLCEITSDAPKVRKPALVTLGEWLSTGSRPIVVGAVALVMLVGVPFGLAYARHTALQSRRAGLESINKSSGDIKLTAAMYRQLETSRAPMTKLLSDIAGAAPVGVEIVETRLSVDQDIAIRGKATSADLHAQFVKNLNATKLFAGSVKPTRTESKDGVTEFELSAKLDNPHLPVKASADFTTLPLAVQLWGEGATNTTMPVGAVRQVTASGKPVTGATRAAGSAATASVDRRPSSSSSASSTEPPPELSDADIAKMNRSEAMKAWSLRAGWVTANSKADPTIRERVVAERDKLRERMTAAGKEEGGAK
ncbi:MAG: PilN domain-containing protein [Phycisphaerae bacterium]|jgi:hypothetical protein